MTKLASFVVLFSLAMSAIAKDTPSQVINWPQSGARVVRVTLGKFKELGSVAGERAYVCDTTVDNVWDKKISHLGFNLYLYDKNKVRIGDGWVTIDNVAPGQTIKFQTT